MLYDCSVRDNISFGCNASEEEIVAAAKTANAHDFVMGLEDGYETNCGEKGTQMSGTSDVLYNLSTIIGLQNNLLKIIG